MYRTNCPPPPPPRAGAPWPLVVALAAVAGGAIVAALFVAYRARVLARPAPTPLPSASAPSLASAPPPTTTKHADDPESEHVLLASAPNGSPAASLRARPGWAPREALTPHAKPTSRFAPQTASPLEAFLSAAPIAGDLERAFVICRVQSWNAHDTFAGDDLHARVTFGATPEVANDGPEDANLAFVSAPLVTMRSGDTVAYRVFDRDVFGITPITTSAVPFRGAPVSATDAGASIECRALAGDTLARNVASRAATADVAIVELSRAKLDPSRPDWAYPSTLRARAERLVADAAALAGWDDPLVKKSVGELDATVLRLAEEKKRIFERAYASAGPSLRHRALDVDVVSASEAQVVVRIHNRGTTDEGLGAFPSTVYLVSREGPSWATVAGAKVPKGATEERTVSTIGHLPEGDLMLAVCAERACSFAKIR